MPIPENSDAMKAAGYLFMDHGCCDACYREIEWWRTPQGRQIPMDPMPRPSAPARGHWSTCDQMVQTKKKEKNGVRGVSAASGVKNRPR